MTRGLTTAEAERRLEEHGPNTLPEPSPPSALVRVGRQLRSSLIYILLVALVADLGVWAAEGAHGVPFESITIGAILALNGALGGWCESGYLAGWCGGRSCHVGSWSCVEEAPVGGSG